MDERIEEIAKQYTLTELESLKSFITKIEENKKTELELKPSISSFSQEYQTYIKNTFSEKYFYSVVSSIKHLVHYFGGERNIASIKVKDAENFKFYLMKKSPRGFRTYIRTIKAMFNKAKEWEHIYENPFSKIKCKKKQDISPTFISKQELNKVLKKTNNSTFRNIFIFAFNTGCRLGEITNLRWKNINLAEGIIIIGDEEFTTKNGKQRIIPISSELKRILLKCNKTNNSKNSFVFSNLNGFRYNKDYVSSRFKIACREAKMREEIHFHTLRHSFASNLANKGVPIIVIKELLGHADISTTQIYSHTNLEQLQSAIRKLNIS
jgi:integrase